MRDRATNQPLRAIETAARPPARSDIAVIGGGIIGVFAAYFLAWRRTATARRC